MVSDNLEIAPNCKGCKLYNVVCGGAEVIIGGNLHYCPQYIKSNANKIIGEGVIAPYPLVIKKTRRRKK